MDEETIRHIRERIERCRRLAGLTSDDFARKALLELADDGEADLRRLQEASIAAEAGDQPRMPDPSAH